MFMPARNTFAPSSGSALIPISDAIATLPTLAQTAAHHSRSERYSVVSTADTLRHLESEGFGVARIKVASVRKTDRFGFEKHAITLRHVNASPVNGVMPEVVLINSHDGSSAWCLFAGLFRFICENGLVVGDSVSAMKVYHRGADLSGAVVDAAHKVIAAQSDVLAMVDTWRGITMSPDAIDAFASEAHAIRFPGFYRADRPEDSRDAPITPAALTIARRNDDTGNDLWSVFNRVQENVVRGGIAGVTVNGRGKMRKLTVRGLRSVDSELSANRALFDLARRTADDLAIAA